MAEKSNSCSVAKESSSLEVEDSREKKKTQKASNQHSVKKNEEESTQTIKPQRVGSTPPYGNERAEKRRERKRGSTKDSVGLYAVQCCECYKWRTVPSKEEFEEIREKFTDEPWFCSRRPDCSCEESADIEYDNSRIWVIDKPNIPKPLPETERLVIMRGDYTKMDTYYVMPNGKRARCTGDVDKFLEAHPEYKDRISSSSFSFAPPKIVEETVSHESAWREAKAKKQDKADFSSGRK